MAGARALTPSQATEIANGVLPPVVAIAASPGAQEVCAKNGLTVAGLFEPFARLSGNGPCPRRTRTSHR